MLIKDEIDIGLVPVAILPALKEYHIISDYCIACDGEVASVCLFSEVPVNDIQTILLDYQSKTSVALLKILLKEHWNIEPKLVDAEQGYELSISGSRNHPKGLRERCLFENLCQKARQSHVQGLGNFFQDQLSNLQEKLNGTIFDLDFGADCVVTTAAWYRAVGSAKKGSHHPLSLWHSQKWLRGV
jgi:hypothetical protein